MAEGRVFGLPPGVSFAECFAAGFRARFGHLPPEAMARAEIFLNSARMRRAVRAALAAEGARLLPRLRLVADPGGALPLAGLPPAAPPLRRLLDLGRLVQALLARAPELGAPTAAFALAESLAALLDEMGTEGVDPGVLVTLDVAGHAAHWQRLRAFLDIVVAYRAAAGGAADPGARLSAGVAALAAAWAAAPPAHPVIVAGSTGSRGATARLIAAVAGLPQGAVVLPGFDFDLPAPAWAAIGDGAAGEDHPQARAAHLCAALGIAPSAVRPWTGAVPPDPPRARLLSLALRPAPVTDVWREEGPALGDPLAATARLTLLEAPSPRAEAAALAVLMREALERGRRVALITPDRGLTRQVAAALDRWGIRPDDSAGEPLALSAPGRLLRQAAAFLGRPATAAALLALLKHPLVHTGAERGPHLVHTRDLERALRARGPAFPTGDDLARWAAGDDARRRWAAWVAGLLGAAGDASPRPLADAVGRHLELAERLAAGPDGTPAALWAEAAGQEARAAVDALRREAAAGGAVTPEAYAELFEQVLAGRAVRDPRLADPRAMIWGTREARVMGADLVLLAGLNEGSWPPAPAADPWLSRPMRRAAGLPLPERQIGLSAHDFQQAAGAPEAVLSRAIRTEEAETVPARWLNRLVTLLAGLGDAGAAALAAMRARGAAALALARALETPAAAVPRAARPAPRPPAAARPRQLSVTEVETLIRDPYAIYARHVLRLRPLEPLRREAHGGLRGEVLHRVMARFVAARESGEEPAAAAARLLALADAALAESVPWPSARRLWRAQLARVAETLAAQERARPGCVLATEVEGARALDDPPFRLVGRADRIDRLPDGQLHILDYKTGRLPSGPQVTHFDKQLLLEAAIAEAGGFAGVPKARVAAVSHVRIGREVEDRRRPLAAEETAAVWADFARLVAAYARPSQGYLARRAPEREDAEGAYDHLARFGEWDLSDRPGEAPA